MTDRSAIFIDAGYVLAEGGRLCCGHKSRSRVICDFGGLVRAIEAWVENHSGRMRPLRTYWYDGAVGGAPTADHDEIAQLPYVKLRLGRVHNGKQKGVDALIYRDLMTLARERAISRAYLVSGDEDLREGVIAAQDMGVQVVLVGVPTTQRANQSHMLIRESDEHVVLTKDFWSPHFRPRDGEQPEPVSARSVGAELAASWLAGASPRDLKRVQREDPYIPRDLDLVLITEAEKRLGPLSERPDEKVALRAAFWATVRGATTVAESS